MHVIPDQGMSGDRVGQGCILDGHTVRCTDQDGTTGRHNGIGAGYLLYLPDPGKVLGRITGREEIQQAVFGFFQHSVTAGGITGKRIGKLLG